MMTNLTRRSVLAGAAAALAGAALVPARAAGPLIDIHHHYFPPELLAAMNGWQAKNHLPPVGGRVGGWTPAASLADMDAAGTTTAILSLASMHGVWFDVPADTIPALARHCNDFAAATVRAHPGRFGFFATLPLPNVTAALAEIGYALDTLHADGIGLSTSYGNVWPGDPSFMPVWEELNRRKAMVVFHPSAPNCCSGLQPGIGESYVEYPTDSARAALSLLFGGALAKYRDVKWTLCHAGGILPVLAGRIDALSGADAARLKTLAPDGIDAEWKRLYYDTANAAYPGPMAALLDEVPVSHVLFGTDYPYVTSPANRKALESLRLPAGDLAAIQSGNANRLLGRPR